MRKKLIGPDPSKNTFNSSALKAIELLRLRKEITARAFRYL
jgi:hypothetical protein